MSGVRIEQPAEASIREIGYIDILLEDEQAKAAVIIENKIWSAEGQDQLHFYRTTIQDKHPNWTIFGVFLTPSGQEPYKERDRKDYKALSYRAVMPMLQDVLRARRSQLADGVELVIKDYLDLWRSILGNTEVETLARQLYSRHHIAVELMNKAPWRKSIEAYLRELITACELFRPEEKRTEYLHFRVATWDDAAGLMSAPVTADRSLPLLYFGFYNRANSLTLYLWLQPEPREGVRKRLLDLVKQSGSTFRHQRNSPGGWHICYEQPFLTSKEYEQCSDDGLYEAIDKEWQKFVDQHLPAIMKAFEAKDWFWHVPEPQQAES